MPWYNVTLEPWILIYLSYKTKTLFKQNVIYTHVKLYTSVDRQSVYSSSVYVQHNKLAATGGKSYEDVKYVIFVMHFLCILYFIICELREI